MDTIEKIRSEIAEYGSIWVEYTIPGHTDRDIEKIVENVLNQAKHQVLAVIDKHQTQKPERKPGKWHLLDECANEGWYCDQCRKKVFKADFSNTMRKYKFCPNCGARMEV